MQFKCGTYLQYGVFCGGWSCQLATLRFVVVLDSVTVSNAAVDSLWKARARTWARVDAH